MSFMESLDYSKSFKRGRERIKYEYSSDCFNWIHNLFIVHFCSLEISFNTLPKALASTLSLLCDALMLYLVGLPWVKIAGSPLANYKRMLAEACIQMCAFCFRLWIHRNGHSLVAAYRLIEDLRLLPNCNKRHQKFRNKIKALLVLHTINFVVLIAVCVLNMTFMEKILTCQFFNFFVYENTSVNVCIVLFYTHVVWNVNVLASIFVIYFYFLCGLFIDSLKNFTRSIRNESAIPSEALNTYNSVTVLLVKLNSMLHTPLLLVNIYILFNSFYGIYISVFDVYSNMTKAPQSIQVLLWSIVIYSIMCSSASKVALTYRNSKKCLHRLLLNDREFADLSVALSLCEDESVGFFLLDSISIKKSLVIKAFGSMLTYGIMIANLRRVSNPVQPKN